MRQQFHQLVLLEHLRPASDGPFLLHRPEEYLSESIPSILLMSWMKRTIQHPEILRGVVRVGPNAARLNQQGKALGSRHVFRIVRAMGERAGILNLFCHQLRHTFASNLRRKKADLLLIKEPPGHASMNTTQIYAHLGNEEYRQEMRALIN